MLPVSRSSFTSPCRCAAPVRSPNRGAWCLLLPIADREKSLPRATIVFEPSNMTIAALLATGASLAFFMGLFISDARAQYYLGGQAGWTGLPYQTDTIDGQAASPVRFNAGYNLGGRGGYRLGPWRFEEEYSYRHNNVA